MWRLRCSKARSVPSDARASARKRTDSRDCLRRSQWDSRKSSRHSHSRSRSATDIANSPSPMLLREIATLMCAAVRSGNLQLWSLKVTGFNLKAHPTLRQLALRLRHERGVRAAAAAKAVMAWCVEVAARGQSQHSPLGAYSDAAGLADFRG